jgi:hypothetical protein
MPVKMRFRRTLAAERQALAPAVQPSRDQAWSKDAGEARTLERGRRRPGRRDRHPYRPFLWNRRNGAVPQESQRGRHPGRRPQVPALPAASGPESRATAPVSAPGPSPRAASQSLRSAINRRCRRTQLGEYPCSARRPRNASAIPASGHWHACLSPFGVSRSRSSPKADRRLVGPRVNCHHQVPVERLGAPPGTTGLCSRRRRPPKIFQPISLSKNLRRSAATFQR